MSRVEFDPKKLKSLGKICFNVLTTLRLVNYEQIEKDGERFV